ncbi:MAG: AraC family transcriptional regulator [Clostridiaceae bacterium]
MKEYWLDAKSAAKGSVSYNHTPSIVAKSTFFYMQSIGHFHCDTSYYTKREGYKSILLICTISGKGYAKYRNREYELDAGKVLLMDCYDYQEYCTYKKSSWEIKYIHFYGSTSQEYFNIIYERYGAVIELKDCSELHAILDEMLGIAAKRDLFPEARLSMLIVQLLTCLLLKGGDSDGSYNVKVSDGHVKMALEFVERNYNKNISLSDMAVYSFCSKYHFARLFKKVTGYGPYEYIMKYRVNVAKNLLKNTEKLVEDIAESVGFASTSNFVRAFREFEGMTPLKYRKYWN